MLLQDPSFESIDPPVRNISNNDKCVLCCDVVVLVHLP